MNDSHNLIKKPFDSTLKRKSNIETLATFRIKHFSPNILYTVYPTKGFAVKKCISDIGKC
jgi:hypothetical protein